MRRGWVRSEVGVWKRMEAEEEAGVGSACTDTGLGARGSVLGTRRRLHTVLGDVSNMVWGSDVVWSGSIVGWWR